MPCILGLLTSTILWLLVGHRVAFNTGKRGLLSPCSRLSARNSGNGEVRLRERDDHDGAGMEGLEEDPAVGGNGLDWDLDADAEALRIRESPASFGKLRVRSLSPRESKRHLPLRPRGLASGDRFEPSEFLPGFSGVRGAEQHGSEEQRSGSRAHSPSQSELNTKDRFDTFVLSTGDRSWTQLPPEPESPKLRSKVVSKEHKQAEPDLPSREKESQLPKLEEINGLAVVGKNVVQRGEVGPSARTKSEGGTRMPQEGEEKLRPNSRLERTRKMSEKELEELKTLEAPRSQENTETSHPLRLLGKVSDPEWEKFQRLKDEQFKSSMLKIQERKMEESRLQEIKVQETKNQEVKGPRSKSQLDSQRIVKNQQLKEQLLKGPHLRDQQLKGQNSKIQQAQKYGGRRSEEWVSLEGISAREATEREARKRAQFDPIRDEQEADQRKQQQQKEQDEQTRRAFQNKNPGVKDVAASLKLYGKGLKGKFKDRFSGRQK